MSDKLKSVIRKIKPNDPDSPLNVNGTNGFINILKSLKLNSQPSELLTDKEKASIIDLSLK